MRVRSLWKMCARELAHRLDLKGTLFKAMNI